MLRRNGHNTVARLLIMVINNTDYFSGRVERSGCVCVCVCVRTTRPTETTFGLDIWHAVRPDTIRSSSIVKVTDQSSRS